jgi:hypothetical protein
MAFMSTMTIATATTKTATMTATSMTTTATAAAAGDQRARHRDREQKGEYYIFVHEKSPFFNKIPLLSQAINLVLQIGDCAINFILIVCAIKLRTQFIDLGLQVIDVSLSVCIACANGEGSTQA